MHFLAQPAHEVLPVLANFDQYERNIVSERAMPPRRYAGNNFLPHFRECSLGRLADQRFQPLDTEHLVVLVKNLRKPVRVENQTVTGFEINFVGGFGWRCFRKTAKNAAFRIEQPDIAF